MPVKLTHISANEAYIIETLRNLQPFEQIIITADKLGKSDSFLLQRSIKVLLTQADPPGVLTAK